MAQGDVQSVWRDIGQFFTGGTSAQAQYNADQATLEYNRQNALLDKQQAYNSAEAEKARQYDTYMSNTSVQRRMADLKAAGINPILAAQQGASTPASPAASSAASASAASSRSSYDSNSNRSSKVSVAVNSAAKAASAAAAIAKLAALLAG